MEPRERIAGLLRQAVARPALRRAAAPVGGRDEHRRRHRHRDAQHRQRLEQGHRGGRRRRRAAQERLAVEHRRQPDVDPQQDRQAARPQGHPQRQPPLLGGSQHLRVLLLPLRGRRPDDG